MKYQSPREEVMMQQSWEDLTSFSRSEESDLMREYRSWIVKRSWIFPYIPGVEAVYVCNSISFNALHDWSDIDLLIITKPHRLWTTRWYSFFMLTVLWLKRRRKRGIRKKFCLSFYIDQRCQNLYPLSLAHDVYLIYWIAHLVPLYARTQEQINDIRTANIRIYKYFPLLQARQYVWLDIGMVYGSRWFKNRGEYRMTWRIWCIGEYMLRVCWMPLVLLKQYCLGVAWRSQIISTTMLKFHHCVRQKIAYLYKKMNQHHSHRA